MPHMFHAQRQAPAPAANMASHRVEDLYKHVVHARDTVV